MAGCSWGLAAAAAISAGGLFSAILAVPYVLGVIAGLGALYLGYLAFRIATAPVGIDRAEPRNASTSAVGGLVLGITNPKAYIAFVSLMASHAIVESDPGIDVAVKWLLCVIVVLVVDLGWLWLGTAIGRISWRPVTERIFNIAMGATIVIATLAALA